jgi:uncharacterized protein (TIGR02246 family)
MTDTDSVSIGLRKAAVCMLLAAAPLPLCAHPNAGAATVAPKPAHHASPMHDDSAVDVVNSFHAALKQGQTDAALALMAEDVVIFESGGVESSRAEYAAHHLEADAAFSAGTTRTPVSELVTVEGNLATIMRVELVTGTFKQRPINSRSVETMLLRKTEGKWRIAHIHWSSANIAR